MLRGYREVAKVRLPNGFSNILKGRGILTELAQVYEESPEISVVYQSTVTREGVNGSHLKLYIPTFPLSHDWRGKILPLSSGVENDFSLFQDEKRLEDLYKKRILRRFFKEHFRGRGEQFVKPSYYESLPALGHDIGITFLWEDIYNVEGLVWSELHNMLNIVTGKVPEFTEEYFITHLKDALVHAVPGQIVLRRFSPSLDNQNVGKIIERLKRYNFRVNYLQNINFFPLNNMDRSILLIEGTYSHPESFNHYERHGNFAIGHNTLFKGTDRMNLEIVLDGHLLPIENFLDIELFEYLVKCLEPE